LVAKCHLEAGSVLTVARDLRSEDDGAAFAAGGGDVERSVRDDAGEHRRSRHHAMFERLKFERRRAKRGAARVVELEAHGDRRTGRLDHIDVVSKIFRLANSLQHATASRAHTEVRGNARAEESLRSAFCLAVRQVVDARGDE
jgi:hypothetical protein